jgi:hypothetical protein
VKIWRWWLDLLALKEPGTTLALFRMACGLCVISTIATVVQSDLVEVIWLNSEHGGIRELGRSTWLVERLGGATPTVVWPLVIGTMFSGLMLALGIGGRVTAFAALQLYMAVTDINGHAGGSYDELLSNALWLLVLAPSSQTLSVGCRRRNGRWTDPTPVAAWPRYLVIFQLVLAYSSTGLQKLSAHWTPVGGFSALYYILQQPSWHRFDMSWAASVYPLTQLATLTTWLFEIGAPLVLLALWFRRTADRPGRLRALFNRLHWRTVFVVVGVQIHLGVFLLMDVGPFTWVTLSLYICLFDPQEWSELSQRLRIRLAR